MSAPWAKLLGLIQGQNTSLAHHLHPIHIGASFIVQKNPPIGIFSIWSTKTIMSRIFLNIETCTMVITCDENSIILNTRDIHVEIRGKKRLSIMYPTPNQLHTSDINTFEFQNRVYTIEFLSVVHMMQHIIYLQTHTRTKYSDVCHDYMLVEQLQNTIDFANEMWTLAMWKELYPYSRIRESLHGAQQSLSDDIQHAESTLIALYNQFYSYAVFAEVTDENVHHYRASYIALLTGKVKALIDHIAIYTRDK